MNWLKLQDKYPNAVGEWAKHHIQLNDVTTCIIQDKEGVFVRWKAYDGKYKSVSPIADIDIMAMPHYFDRHGIFIKTDVYWGVQDERHAVEISIRKGKTIVCNQNGEWSETLSHKAHIHKDRSAAIAYAVPKAFAIRQSHIEQYVLENIKREKIDELERQINKLEQQRYKSSNERLNAAIADLRQAITEILRA